MDVLVLGGTRFLGRAVVDALLANGSRVTLVHRALSEPNGIPGTESIVFDRAEGHAPLRDRHWDAAIDLSGTLPAIVADAAQTLAERVGRYLYVSSISVYREDAAPPIDEASATVDIPETLPDEVTIEAYGAQKVLSERAVQAAFGDRAIVVRPGLIVGPRDRSDRFTYWVRRVARGGTVLAPGRPERPVQFIDVRDLGAWIARAVAAGASGTFNATGPAAPLSMGDLLATCALVAGASPRFVWVSDGTMTAEGLGPWMEVPLWVPEGEDALVSDVDCRRAIAAGLTFRSLEETVRATLDWIARGLKTNRCRPA